MADLDIKENATIIKTDYKKAHSWKIICNVTLSNYTNMEKRLSFLKSFSNIMLIYYSIFLIINTITSKYFSFYNAVLAEYLGLIISVTMLAFSVVNNYSNYAQRIEKITDSINKMKNIKRTINEDDFNPKEFSALYNEITDNTEVRSDSDFFLTIKQLCKDNNIPWMIKPSKINVKNEMGEKIKSYLSEINRINLTLKSIFKIFLECCLILLPIFAFVICILF